MALTRKEVEHVSKLARLELTEEEIGLFSDQLTQIVNYFDAIKTVDTRGVAERRAEFRAPFRDDEPRPSLSREQALANAPKAVDGFFSVPKIIADR